MDWTRVFRSACGRSTRGRATVVLTIGVLLATSTPAWALPRGERETLSGRTVNLVVSMFQYCRQDPCRVTDHGYVRGLSGPVEGTDNPAAMVEVSPGDTVTWTYRDTVGCDPFTQPFVDCKGHEVQFENGTPGGAGSIGFMPARSGPVSISWVVPADAKRGSAIRYYCNLRSNTIGDGQYPAGTDVLSAHYLYGMTGTFRVV